MAKWYQALPEGLFKPVSGGYVFQSPNPWIFARSRNYLVNEEQKAEIIVLMGRSMRIVVPLTAITFLILPFAFLMLARARLVGLFQPPFQLDGDIFAVLLGTLLLALLVAVPRIYLRRRLGPLLADAPRTNERIKTRDQLPKIAAAAPGWVLVAGMVLVLVGIGAGVFRSVDAFFAGDVARTPLSYLPSLLINGLLTACFVYFLRLKAKLKRNAL